MRIVPIKELLSLSKNEHNKFLWPFLEDDLSSNFISDKEKKEYISWIKKVNQNHHNDGSFYSNLKEIFIEDGKSFFLEGQEDLGGIGIKNVVVIVRNAEMGITFTLSKIDASPINEDDWKNYQKVLSALDLAFINAKDFHFLKSFDNISNELKIKDSVKEQKVKI